MKNTKFIFYLLLIFAVSLDQFTKNIILEKYNIGITYPVLKDVFHITPIENRGIAFGLFQGIPSIFIIFFGVIFILLIALYLRKSRSGKIIHNIGFSFILGGASSNLIDRIKFGYVIDFIDIRVWPIFNFADIFIVIGAILLFADILRS